MSSLKKNDSFILLAFKTLKFLKSLLVIKKNNQETNGPTDYEVKVKEFIMS